MPDPKPPAGHDSWLSYCLNASTSIVPVDTWKLAVDELDILRADAEAYRLLKKRNEPRKEIDHEPTSNTGTNPEEQQDDCPATDAR